MPIAKFEAIQERLGRLAATAYLLDAARRMTCAALDEGHHPAVVTAIMKSQATDRMRVSVNDAMDVHGGKGIIEGPLNYLGSLYRGVPIGITVEGANIVTRSLIQFGQGAIRSHPYLLKEMMALQDTDRARGLDAFDQAFWGHVGHSIANTFRAWGRAWTGGLFAPAPDAGAATPFYRQLGRYTSAFALAVDLALLSLGGGLKRQEMVSARFGDILSELYLSSAALKRWNDEGRQKDDLPLLEYCLEASFATIETRFDEIIMNFPVRPVAWLLRFFIQPLSPSSRGPSDRVTAQCAEIITSPCPARDRLTVDLFKPTHIVGEHVDGVAVLEHAFAQVVAVQPIRDRMRTARVRDIGLAREAAHHHRRRGRAAQGRGRSGGGGDRGRRLRARGADSAASVNKGDVSSQATSQPRSADAASPARRGGVERRPVYIVDGSRTPFIKARGKPGPFTPVDLAVQCGRPLLLRQPFAPDAFDQVILGCVNVIADEMNPARVAALRLGMGEAMTAFTVQINCGSGMQSIDTAYRYIQNGTVGPDPGGRRGIAQPRAAGVQPQRGRLVCRHVRGPRASAPSSRRCCSFRPSMLTPVIGLERGLTDPITDLNMGQTAELVSHLFHITRRQADEYAAESQQRLAQGADRKAGSRTRSSRPSPATARCSTMTMACGRTARPTVSPSSSPPSSGRGAR